MNSPITETANFEQFDFSILLNSTSGKVKKGESTTTKVTAKLLSGSTQSVEFSCSNLPTGVSCKFGKTGCKPTCKSTLTIKTTEQTPKGTYSITVSGKAGGLTKSVNYKLTVKK